ncbi:MAG: RraA family protein, partial [Burkholderiales bacterium]|nr:RraA family protein [Burkholderiales bacterium]
MSSSTELTARLETLYTGAVHDVMRAMGHANCVLPSKIKALDSATKLAGEVYTVSGHIDQTREAHDTLVQWTGLLSKAPPDKVLVCQPNTHMVALMGELSAETLHYKKVRGYVVDGGCRDTEFILNIGFPVFCSFYTPADIVGRWVPDRFGEPI